jgi:hypothetical protein
MTQLTREDLVVARRPGSRLFLSAGPKTPLAFEGPSERTLFFRQDTAEDELHALKIPLDSVELRPAKLSAQIG